MCHAWEHIKHLRSVNLTGYVKTCTRTKWVQRLHSHSDKLAAEERVQSELLDWKAMPASEL